MKRLTRARVAKKNTTDQIEGIDWDAELDAELDDAELGSLT